MSGGGDDLFGPYSQPDQQFSSGYYPPLPPPFSPPRLDNTGSQGPGHGLPGFDLNNPYRTSSAASAHGGMAGLSGYAGYGGPMSAATPHGGMAGPSHGYGGTMSAATSHGGMFGPSHGYSGYGGPSGYFQMPFHAGGQHMSQPARHSTSSLSGFEGGPYASDLANQLPPMLPSYGPYGEGSSHGGCVHMSYASPSWHLATMRNEEMSSAAPRRRRGPRTQVLQQPGFLDAEVASNDHSMPAVDESSSGDNAAIVGNAAVVEDEEGSGGSMGGQGEGSSSDGDLDWSSDDDSSDEHYEELYKALDDAYGDEEDWSSDDDSSDGLYEEFYKVLDDVYGDEEPVIVQAIKELSENSRRELKQLKKVVVRAMYEESMNRHVREIKETRAEFVERTLRSLRQC